VTFSETAAGGNGATNTIPVTIDGTTVTLNNGYQILLPTSVPVDGAETDVPYRDASGATNATFTFVKMGNSFTSTSSGPKVTCVKAG